MYICTHTIFVHTYDYLRSKYFIIGVFYVSQGVGCFSPLYNTQ